jgi:hypothetical protein
MNVAVNAGSIKPSSASSSCPSRTVCGSAEYDKRSMTPTLDRWTMGRGLVPARSFGVLLVCILFRTAVERLSP